MRIGFFGAGNMARAIAIAIKNNPDLKNIQSYFFTPSKTKAEELANLTSGIFVEELKNMPKDLDLYFLGFKPQNLNDFHFDFGQNSKIISMLAGTSLEGLNKKFPQTIIARLMPNTPSSVGAGMNLIYFPENFGPEIKNKSYELLRSCGQLEVLDSENLIDTITPFSGSGPGVIFEFAHYFEQSLLEILNSEYKNHNIDTRKIIAETFLGSSLLMTNSKTSFVELRDQVTSKKGVTYEALKTMQDNKMNNIMFEAFQNAIKRIEELKRGL